MKHPIVSPFYEIDKLELARYLVNVAREQGLRPWNLAIICGVREEHFYHLGCGNCAMSLDIFLILMMHLGVTMKDLEDAGIVSRRKHASL